jgi:hypothetical protein
LINLASRIGSPAENAARVIEPATWLMASGLSDLRMKFALAAAAGQVCQLLGGNRMAQSDVRIGDQDVDGFQLDDRGGGGRLRRRVGSSGQQRGNAASGDGDHEHNDTRGFHTLHFPLITLRPNATATATRRPNRNVVVHRGFQQLNVKAWLMRRIQIELIVRSVTGFAHADAFAAVRCAARLTIA